MRELSATMHGERPRTGRRARRLAAVLATLALASLVLAGCDKTKHHVAGGETMVRAIAVVNNEPIPYEPFQSDYQLFVTRWDRFIGNDQVRKQEVKRLLLQRRIDDKLIDQEAKRRGITVSDAELNKRTMDLLGAYLSDEEGAGIGTALNEAALAQWTQDLRRRLVHKKVIEQEVLARIQVTPAETHSYYEKHREVFHLPERVKVRHIAVSSKALYNKVMALLRRHADFGDLVEKYSITPDRADGGELGYVERGVLPEEFDKAIFDLKKVGAISSRHEPVQTQMGYHIFRLEGRKPEETLDYRDAIPEIRKRIKVEKESGAYRAWIASLRDAATIEIDRQLLTVE